MLSVLSLNALSSSNLSNHFAAPCSCWGASSSSLPPSRNRLRRERVEFHWFANAVLIAFALCPSSGLASLSACDVSFPARRACLSGILVRHACQARCKACPGLRAWHSCHTTCDIDLGPPSASLSEPREPNHKEEQKGGRKPSWYQPSYYYQNTPCPLINSEGRCNPGQQWQGERRKTMALKPLDIMGRQSRLITANHRHDH